MIPIPKLLSSFIFGSVLLSCSFAQSGLYTPKLSIQLKPKERILEVKKVGGSSFLLRTGFEFFNKNDNQRLFLCDSSLKLQWETPLPDAYENGIDRGLLIAGPHSANTFFVYETVALVGAQQVKVHSYNAKGELVSTFEQKPGNNKVEDIIQAPKKGIRWPEWSDFNSKKVAYLTCHSKLYILEALKGKSKSKPSESAIRIALYCFNPETEKIDAVLTDIELPVEKMYWEAFIDVELIGYDQENIYLAYKQVEPKNKALTYELYTLDYHGKTSSTQKITVTTNGYPAAASYRRQLNGPYNFISDYVVSSGSRGTMYLLNSGSFGGCVLDQPHQRFYVYGITGEKQARDLVGMNLPYDKASHLFVQSFDLTTGSLINKSEIPFPEQMLIDKNWSAYASYNMLANPPEFKDRFLWLDILNNKYVRLNGGYLGSGIAHSFLVKTGSSDAEYVGKNIVNGFGMENIALKVNLFEHRWEHPLASHAFLASFKELFSKDQSMFAIPFGAVKVYVTVEKSAQGLKLDCYSFPFPPESLPE